MGIYPFFGVVYKVCMYTILGEKGRGDSHEC